VDRADRNEGEGGKNSKGNHHNANSELPSSTIVSARSSLGCKKRRRTALLIAFEFSFEGLSAQI
jgi:hypothetical protein